MRDSLEKEWGREEKRRDYGEGGIPTLLFDTAEIINICLGFGDLLEIGSI